MNVCKRIISSQGILEQAINMKKSLDTKLIPESKTVLEKYADFLAINYTDIFS